MIIDWLHANALYQHLRVIEKMRGCTRKIPHIVLEDGYMELDTYEIFRDGVEDPMKWGAREIGIFRHLQSAYPHPVSREELGRYWTAGQPTALDEGVDWINESLGVEAIERVQGGIAYKWSLEVLFREE